MSMTSRLKSWSLSYRMLSRAARVGELRTPLSNYGSDGDIESIMKSLALKMSLIISFAAKTLPIGRINV